ncbi:metal ABC transporter ATPase [Burkholderia cenocepacia]
MGVGMQIVYLGFAGSAELEAEAATRLVDIERFRALISGCHLAIEARRMPGGMRAYDVRLDLITRNDELKPLPHCSGDDVCETVRRAFAAAECALIAWQAQDGASAPLRTAPSGGASGGMSAMR